MTSSDRASEPAPTSSTIDEVRAIARLAAPIALAQVGLVSMSLVDTAMLGRVSDRDLAGHAVASAIGFAVITLPMGATFAIEPLAAQALGAGEPARAWNAFRAAIRAALLLCGLALVFAVVFAGVLGPLGIATTIVAPARASLAAQFPGRIAFVLFLAGKSYLQAHGRTRPAIVAAVAGNVANGVVCAVLVLGDRLRHVPLVGPWLPHSLGAFGAGVATTAGSVAMAWWVLRAASKLREAELGTRRHDAVVDERDAAQSVDVRRVLRLGAPMGLQLLAEVGVFSIVSMAAGRLGPRVVSAHQIALSLASMTFMAALGVSGATAVRVGHAVGRGASARKPGLIGIALGMCVMSFGAFAFVAAPRTLMALFTPNPATIDLGARLLWIAALFALFDGVQAVASGALRGAGDTFVPFLANVVCHWAIGFPVAIALGFGAHWGAQGLWWGLTAGLVAISIALTIRFVRLSSGPIRRV